MQTRAILAYLKLLQLFESEVNQLFIILIPFFAAHENSVDAITCDPTSDRLFASGSHDKTIKLWDAQKPQKALNTLTGNKNGIWSLNYSHDGKRLLSASSEGLCKIWDVKSGKCTTELTAHMGHKVRIYSRNE